MRTEIPFRLVGGEQPLIVVSARFNGSHPIDCALDTGASHAMLLPEVGARLGVQVEETREAKGAGGAITVRIGKAATVALGDAVVRDVPVLMTGDLERIGAAIGHPLGGNIGHSFLGRFRLGAVSLSRVRVAVAPFLEGLGQAVGTRIDGIVGTNVLRRFRVTIDYPGKTLRLA